MNLRAWARKLDGRLFPPVSYLERNFPWYTKAAGLVGMTLLFSLVGVLQPADGFYGFDWLHFWGAGILAPFHMPWTLGITNLLTWPMLIGISLAAFALAVAQRARSAISAVLAFVSLPLLWTLFLGQLEGISLLGVLGLPWLAPIALLKPQITFFAFFARRSWLIAGLVVLVISLFIWGLWPLQMLGYDDYHAEGRFAQNIALGWWGLPVALVMAWYSRGDPDLLMLAGGFATPYLIPYNLLPVCPAIARLRPRTAALAVLFSWLPFAANWLGPGGWWLGVDFRCLGLG
jgi:hypothetical protein